MNIRAQRTGTTMVLDIDGPLTVQADTRRLHGYVRRLKRLDVRNVVLDLDRVGRVDAHGVGQLVALHNEVQPLGTTLVLANVDPRQKRLLQVAGLLAVFPVFDTWQEAVARCEYATGLAGREAAVLPEATPDWAARIPELLHAHAC
jgi:anti-anti-sigma factor